MLIGPVEFDMSCRQVSPVIMHTFSHAHTHTHNYMIPSQLTPGEDDNIKYIIYMISLTFNSKIKLSANIFTKSEGRS